MQKFLIGRKIGMSQVFDRNGAAIAVTMVETLPLTVISTRTPEKDGYQAVQFGYETRRAKIVAKPQREAWKGLSNFAIVREARNMSGMERGAVLDLAQFQEGDVVKASGISKARGFQGVVKRHGFHGAPATHGTKHAHREPGSIGATWPQRVIKGRRMAGRMGGERVTLSSVRIIKIDQERNVLALSGAIPGRRGTVIEISA